MSGVVFDLSFLPDGLPAAQNLRIEARFDGVHVEVVVDTPQDVHAWADRLGAEVTENDGIVRATRRPYRTTTAVMRTLSLRLQVSACVLGPRPAEAVAA